ncbi:hypothetical protein [Thermosediminibacter litoriperuensis]|uniref:Uncharacterized protein n=1 Tax=Thermosediminibacter litoriperuensis TaxID=291989 RepID=A0A5S5AG23_9FIRM|nr:hypothetical protein [Thermosediminibacter litoriperuensis]TYP49212.1 hypothetical protein LZ11_02221 [Thermosediminibacter litoriperuensis]
MQLNIELYAGRAIHIADYHEISLAVTSNGEIIEDSASLDYFGFFGVILGGKRVAATGRRIHYSFKDLAGIFEAEPAQPFRILFLDPEDEILLTVDTNIWLDPGLLVQDLVLQVSSENKSLEIPLNRPNVKIDWPGRGRFVIDVSEYIKTLYAERARIS